MLMTMMIGAMMRRIITTNNKRIMKDTVQ